MKTSLLLFFLLFLVSCGAKKVYHTELSIHPNAAKYVGTFESQLGKDIKDLKVTYAKLSDDRVLGYCEIGTRVNREYGVEVVDHVYATPKIVLNTTHWEKLSLASKEQLIYHELGHCVLGRPHETRLENKTPVSLMYPYHLGTEIYVSNYASYISELFSRPSAAYARMTFDGTVYASTIGTDFDEMETADYQMEDLHDGCVHDKGTIVIDEKTNEQVGE